MDDNAYLKQTLEIIAERNDVGASIVERKITELQKENERLRNEIKEQRVTILRLQKSVAEQIRAEFAARELASKRGERMKKIYDTCKKAMQGEYMPVAEWGEVLAMFDENGEPK